MKIALVVTRFPVVSQTFVFEHVIGLLRRGHQVTVYAVNAKYPAGLKALETESGFTMVYVDLKGRGALRRVGHLMGGLTRALVGAPGKLVTAFMKSLRVKSPDPLLIECLCSAVDAKAHDLVHAHFGTVGRSLIDRWGESLRGRLVVTWHGFDFLEAAKAPTEFEPLIREGIYHTVNSDFSRQWFHQLFGSRQEPYCIPMGVDLAKFQAQAKEKPGDILNLVSVGRFVDCKDHALAVKVVADLIEEGYPLAFDLVGDGPGREALSEQVAARGLSDRIRLHGLQPHAAVVEFLNAADLFILLGVKAATGRQETQGVVYIEAQAMGLPCIASRVGGVPGSLSEGVTGFLCEPSAEDEVRAALMRFIQEPALKQAMGTAAQAFVEREFSMAKMLDRFEELYQECLVRL